MTNIARLDYEPTKILMECTTQVEEAYRIHAVAKEIWTKDFVESIPVGGCFYDIGANVGSYTLIAASRGIRTVAIEPAAQNYATLVRNLALNAPALEYVIPVPLPLADVNGTMWFDYAGMESGAAGHALGSRRRLHHHRQAMMAVRLDTLIELWGLPLPSHIKVDVDGNEDAVLGGMEATLQRAELQAIMLEMPLAQEAELTAWLVERGWTLTERYNMRGDVQIAGIAYGLFQRTV